MRGLCEGREVASSIRDATAAVVRRGPCQRRPRHGVLHRRKAYPNGNGNGNGNGLGGAHSNGHAAEGNPSDPTFGPEVPPDVPDWVKDMYREAASDPVEKAHVKELLDGTGGDVRKIEANARRKLAERTPPMREGAFQDAQMRVSFGEVDSFSLWVWFEFFSPPNEAEREMLQHVVESWYILGKLGAYNSLNLQLNDAFDLGSASHFTYDVQRLQDGLPSGFHDMQPLEVMPPLEGAGHDGEDGEVADSGTDEGTVARFWVNMGTCDEMAIDVLLNALQNFSLECCSLRETHVGDSAWRDWRAPKMPSLFEEPTNA